MCEHMSCVRPPGRAVPLRWLPKQATVMLNSWGDTSTVACSRATRFWISLRTAKPVRGLFHCIALTLHFIAGSAGHRKS